MVLLMVLKDHWELRMEIRPESLQDKWTSKGERQGLGLGVSSGQGALRRGRGEEEFKGWRFLQEG